MIMTYPTPKQMQEFAKQFRQQEWRWLCSEVRFNVYITTDLSKAADVAENVLHKSVKMPTGVRRIVEEQELPEEQSCSNSNLSS